MEASLKKTSSTLTGLRSRRPPLLAGRVKLQAEGLGPQVTVAQGWSVVGPEGWLEGWMALQALLVLSDWWSGADCRLLTAD
jgi:hypothetical protein